MRLYVTILAAYVTGRALVGAYNAERDIRALQRFRFGVGGGR